MGTVVGLCVHPLQADVLACAISKHCLHVEIYFSGAKTLLLHLFGHWIPALQGQGGEVPEAVMVIVG